MSGGAVDGVGRVVRLEAVAREAIRSHLEASYPEEACGGLLAEDPEGAVLQVQVALPVENERREERDRRYLIGPDDVLALERRAERKGLELVGYYHSHPNAPAVPSEYDRAHAWPWYTYLIVSVRDGRAAEVRAWRLLEDRSGFEEVETRDADGFNQ